MIGAAEGRARITSLTSQQYNGPGDAVARDLGVRGPVTTLSTACTSGTLAVAAGYDAVRSGEIDVAIVGGADSLCRITYGGFNALRAVDREPCRPFRAERAGLSLGEGAAVLVLERSDRDGAAPEPLAELVGVGSTCDAHHMTAPEPSGSGARAAMFEALEGLDGEVEFVNLHGTGTPHNDAAEWGALSTLLGAETRGVPMTATKGSIGHLLGSAGAIEAVVTVLCLNRRLVHPTPGPAPVDPECPVPLVLGRPQPIGGKGLGLSVNLAFGGSNAALAFRGLP